MKDWGFWGIICTDGGALMDLVRDHHYASDLAEGAAAAIHAGINQFLDRYVEPVHQALQRGLITERDIDENLRGVFRVIIRLGLLDPPSRVSYTKINAQNTPQAPWDSAAHRMLARIAAEKSVVLLKNSDRLLPLDLQSLHSIAVLGPRADEVGSGLV